MDNLIKPTLLTYFGLEDRFSSYSKKVLILVDRLYIGEWDKNDYDLIVVIQGCEPDIIENGCKQFVNKLIECHDMFDLILATNEDVLKKCPNAKLFPWGGTSWINFETFDHRKKQFELSFLCGNRNSLNLPGKIIAHQIFEHIGKIRNIPLKLWYEMHGDPNILNGRCKNILYESSQFNVVIQNVISSSYFTDKLSDCLISKCIPVFWGAENIGNYFDLRGFIRFRTEDEFFDKVSKINDAIYYDRLKYVEENYKIAHSYGGHKSYWKRVDIEINSLIQKKYTKNIL